MGEFARALGQSETLPFKGKEYRLSPMSLEVFALWEQYLEQRAFAVLDRRQAAAIAAGNFNPALFAQKEQDLVERIAAGHYSFFSQASADAQQSILSDGWKNMLRIRLQVLQPEVTMALVNEMVEDQADKIIRLLHLMDAPDPNSPTPATATEPGDASEPKPSSPASATAA